MKPGTELAACPHSHTVGDHGPLTAGDQGGCPASSPSRLCSGTRQDSSRRCHWSQFHSETHWPTREELKIGASRQSSRLQARAEGPAWSYSLLRSISWDNSTSTAQHHRTLMTRRAQGLRLHTLIWQALQRGSLTSPASLIHRSTAKPRTRVSPMPGGPKFTGYLSSGSSLELILNFTFKVNKFADVISNALANPKQ